MTPASCSEPLFLQSPPRLLFFTGKGGVGKTSVACAAAVALADKGRLVLLVSTDPASNLGQVFEMTIRPDEPTAIPGVPGLSALNIDPHAAAQAYRDRIVGPVRGILPEETLRLMEEQLSGACTTEIAAFDEFTALLIDGEKTQAFDHILFDTAPTGHTLRLLKLPSAWSDFFESNRLGASCLGPLSGLDKQKEQYAHAVSLLADAKATKIVLVTRLQRPALAEADRTSQELATLGIRNHHLVVNGVMPETDSTDPMANALRTREQAAFHSLSPWLAQLPQDEIPLRPFNLVGVDALRRFFAAEPQKFPVSAPIAPEHGHSFPQLSALVEEMETAGKGLVMVLGKGGVGKTTIASAIAVALALRGHSVHLTTTDPAAHLAMTVESPLPNLQVSRIDPQVESERYRREVLATQGSRLDDAGRQLLEEDLRSPCTEEIAVFHAFSRVVQESHGKFVVVDTAPTGHTLLLLDATGAYHREAMRHQKSIATPATLLMQLRDPVQTRMVIVTLPETTPVLEAESLQAELRRAGIEPWAWVVNSSFWAAKPADPLLRARAAAERRHIKHVQDNVPRVALVPWLVQEPLGILALLELMPP